MDMFWAIGLFEGEGCIHIVKSKPQVMLRLTSTDLDVLEKFKAIMGCGCIITRKKLQEHHKQAYEWRTKGRLIVTDILTEWLPYLSQRRAAKAQQAIEHLSTR